MEKSEKNRRIFYKEDINKENICILDLYGVKLKKVIYIKFKNQHGVVIDKCMRVIVDGDIHKKLLSDNGVQSSELMFAGDNLCTNLPHTYIFYLDPQK